VNLKGERDGVGLPLRGSYRLKPPRYSVGAARPEKGAGSRLSALDTCLTESPGRGKKTSGGRPPVPIENFTGKP